MKKVIGSICSALFCLGVIGVEYKMAYHFGSMLLFASVASLGALLITLFRAPEGYQSFVAFTFVRATRGRAVFAVFASPDQPVRRDQT